MFITVLQLSSILPCMRLIFFTESNLKNLVATLIIDCGNRPKLIKDKDEGRLKVNIESGLEAPRGKGCLLYTSPSPRDLSTSRMPSSA